jgi:hypothetical protein
MSEPITISCNFHFQQKEKGKKELVTGKQPEVPRGRIPRISRLMALAIRFDTLIRDGSIVNHSELARLGKISRARVSQMMSLLNLAPDIIEALLFLPRIETGRASVTLRQVLPLCQIWDWNRQRKRWQEITSLGLVGSVRSK